MNIKITDKNGIILKTAKKYCPEDISITLDEDLGGKSASITVPGKEYVFFFLS